ncbi:hypothetical protein BD779DRAFT_1473283 [Infundibulicybe gibba]|nr:hypothetical protein BD779DRAFT_1473283 [Infundibulicybe gibba]
MCLKILTVFNVPSNCRFDGQKWCWTEQWLLPIPRGGGAFYPYEPHADDITPRFPYLRTFRVFGPFGLGSYLVALEHCEHLAIRGIRVIARTLDQLGKSHDDVSRGSKELQSIIRYIGPLVPVKDWFCAHLRSLEIHHCSGLNPTQLRNTVAARLAAASPAVDALSSLIVYDEQELPESDRVWFEANLAQFRWTTRRNPHPLIIKSNRQTN